jgi:anti-sigma factor ChrR (cupin superfamily)
MKTAKLNQMIKGWFVGDFEPSIFKSEHVEVAVKHYKAGDKEERHVHKIGTEITLIVQGSVKMNGAEYRSGDIVLLTPGEASDFEALTDAINVVVKTPSIRGDKYVV